MLTAKKTMELHKELWMEISLLLQNNHYCEKIFVHALDPIEEIKLEVIKDIVKREGINFPKNYSFLCQYSEEYRAKDMCLRRICLCTKNGSCKVPCIDGLLSYFAKMVLQRKWNEASKIAEKIANLPLNKKYIDD